MIKDSKDYVGKRFGRLLAMEKQIVSGRGHYVCRCDCGNEKLIRGDSLSSGSTKSCGCLTKDVNKSVHRTHGDSDTRLYKIYHKIINRCYNPNNYRYERYGGRGITVCREWLEGYENFKEWAVQNHYKDNLSIDRIDIDGGYSPENCRWADIRTQMNNTSRNIFIEYNGEVKTLARWCEELDYPYNSTRMLLKKGDKSVKEVFTRPKIGRGFRGTEN